MSCRHISSAELDRANWIVVKRVLVRSEDGLIWGSLEIPAAASSTQAGRARPGLRRPASHTFA